MKYIITENRMTNLIDKMIKQIYPQFNFHDTLIATHSNGDDTYLEYYSDELKKTFVKYYVWQNELQLNHELFSKLEDYFGEENLSFVIDWFNKEFNQDATSVTF